MKENKRTALKGTKSKYVENLIWLYNQFWIPFREEKKKNKKWKPRKYREYKSFENFAYEVMCVCFIALLFSSFGGKKAKEK